MLQAQSLPSSQTSEATQPKLSESELSQPEREKARLLVYGSRRAISYTINQLQLLHYVEHFRWTPIQKIPDNGIHLTPEEADAYSFLVRELLIDETIRSLGFGRTQRS